jgi:pilus assembly protein CpaC
VSLPSGGSLVIAGLLQNDIRNTIDGFPGLKDIPVLGALFRSVDFQRDESELVITVTPYLVRPIGESAISLPTDGFAPASDVDMYFLGRLHGVYAPSQPAENTAGYEGPIGYILE